MYLSIGKNVIIPEENIIGIFDLDNCTQSRITRDFLSSAEKRGEMVNSAEDLPNSFIISNKKIILAQTSSRNLVKKIQNGEINGRTE